MTAGAMGTTGGVASGVREVDARTLQRWLGAGECELIDVREPDEFAQERIAGSRLMPLSRLDARAAAPRAGRRVVFQCKSGRRSSDAARAVAAATVGGGEIYNLVGGIEAWKKESLPVEQGAEARGGGGGARIGVMQQTQLAIGVMVLAGVAIGYLVHPLGLVLSAFMGCGLLLAGLTGVCPLASLIARMPWNKGAKECCGRS